MNASPGERLPATPDDFTQAARAEAARLYPDVNWDPTEREPVDDYGYPAAQRSAFVAGADWQDRRISAALSTQAVSWTPEEIEDAAKALHAGLYAVHETAWVEISELHRARWRDLARKALTAVSARRGARS